jgi:hypothetical protein
MENRGGNMFVSHAWLALGLALAVVPASVALGQPSLSIYQIQSTTTDGDASYYHGDVVNCPGGVVTFKRVGLRPRIILQHPDHPDGWGAIQVKDFAGTGAFNDVQVGDWVTLTRVEVEEYRGTTFLQWYEFNNPELQVTSTGNALPDPILLMANQIPAPIYDDIEDGWFVENHNAELYESMRIVVRDVTVTEMDLGKADPPDNYNLQDGPGDDCWASDYMNADKPALEEYHAFVELNAEFCAVAGILEQYTNLSAGWDYYQLLTLHTSDLMFCGDSDSDAGTDLADFARFQECFVGPVCDVGGCSPPAWTAPPADLPLQHCLMMDLDYDGDVDLVDFTGLHDLLDAP